MLFRSTTYEKGDVVILPIRFSNNTQSKKRPGPIITTPKGRDLIVLLITSKEPQSPYGIKLREEDFTKGSLKRTSYVKTNFISTVEKSIITNKAGTLKKEKVKEIERKLILLFTKN